ncbi:hypothetical protein [Halarchaeum grantii]|uniref:hypothetical protein n=1 Tax=Halarchaeum grantii TaxID=1193105 RepID=UPI00166E0D67|nr:hypothetical protein [Halarchaeum grantii]
MTDGGETTMHRVPDIEEVEAARDDLEAVDAVRSVEARPSDSPRGIFVDFPEFNTTDCIYQVRQKHGLFISRVDKKEDGSFGVWLLFTEGAK